MYVDDGVVSKTIHGILNEDPENVLGEYWKERPLKETIMGRNEIWKKVFLKKVGGNTNHRH